MQYIPPWPIFLGPCGHPSAQKVLDQLDLQKQSTNVSYNYISSLHLIAYKPRPQATLTFSLLHAEKKNGSLGTGNEATHEYELSNTCSFGKGLKLTLFKLSKSCSTRPAHLLDEPEADIVLHSDRESSDYDRPYP